MVVEVIRVIKVIKVIEVIMVAKVIRVIKATLKHQITHLLIELVITIIFTQ